mgnify:FL=1
MSNGYPEWYCGKCCWPNDEATNADNCQLFCDSNLGSAEECLNIHPDAHWVPQAQSTCVDGEECTDCSDDCYNHCGACCYLNFMEERVCEIMTWDLCNLKPTSQFFDGKKCIQIDSNTAEEYDLCDESDVTTTSTTTSSSSTTTTTTTQDPSEPPGDCEPCPKEIACVEWVACRQGDLWNYFENKCKQCIVLPRGGSELLDGMVVNSACRTFEELDAIDMHPCGTSNGTVDNQVTDACRDGGRYKVTKLGNCNDNPFWAQFLGIYTCSLRDILCNDPNNEAGGCKASLTNDNEGTIYFEDNPTYVGVQCGEELLIDQGCCEDMSAQEWGGYNWQDPETIGPGCCKRCNKSGNMFCHMCDGCEDITSEAGCGESGRLPGDCCDCWEHPKNLQVGWACVDFSQGEESPNGKITDCDIGCSDCSGIQNEVLMNCPCNFTCDCIEQGMDQGDYCCPGGREPIMGPLGPIGCPDTQCLGMLLEDTQHSPRSCECIRCYGSQGGGETCTGAGGGDEPQEGDPCQSDEDCQGEANVLCCVTLIGGEGQCAPCGLGGSGSGLLGIPEGFIQIYQNREYIWIEDKMTGNGND